MGDDVFGIGFGEFLLLAVLALLVVGPEKLPQFAADLGRFIRQVRRIARSAQEEVRGSIGPELRELDPRTYLHDDLDDLDDRPLRPGSGSTSLSQRDRDASLRPGERPPYDADAT